MKLATKWNRRIFAAVLGAAVVGAPLFAVHADPAFSRDGERYDVRRGMSAVMKRGLPTAATSTSALASTPTRNTRQRAKNSAARTKRSAKPKRAARK